VPDGGNSTTIDPTSTARRSPSRTPPTRSRRHRCRPRVLGHARALVGRAESTPLEDDEPEGTIPPSPLWAMKTGAHPVAPPPHTSATTGSAPSREADGTVYVIDDGRHHVSSDGESIDAECEYCLIGRCQIERYEQLASGAVPALDAFRRRRRDDGLRRGRRGGRRLVERLRRRRYDAPGDSRAPTGRRALLQRRRPRDHALLSGRLTGRSTSFGGGGAAARSFWSRRAARSPGASEPVSSGAARGPPLEQLGQPSLAARRSRSMAHGPRGEHEPGAPVPSARR